MESRNRFFFFFSGVHNLDFGIPFLPFLIFQVTLEAFGSFSVEWP